MAGTNQLIADVIKGALAGAAATWIMGRVTTALYARENAAARRREDDARGGATAYETAAERTARLLGLQLSERARARTGQAIHWGLGIGTGALYGALRPRLRGLDRAQGLGFGTGFWLLVDEAMVPTLGLTPGPTHFPWQTHARGLAGHLAFGLAADTALDLMDRIA